MRKILVVITTGFEVTGGLTTVMMNYYRAMEKNRLHIDFASINDAEDVLIKELQKNGSHYYNLGERKKRLISYIKKLRELLLKNKYDVIHINGNSSTMLVESFLAKQCGVSEIICHTHTTKSEYPFIHRILQPFFRRSYTKAIAVSEKAGQWLFGEGFIVLNDAIDAKKYAYNRDVRLRLCRELGLEGRYVIGTVGKLNVSKNQAFLLDVFADYHRRDNNSILVIAGDGELKEELMNKGKELGILDSVIFLGMRRDIEQVLQCFDIFVFTSFYEGFGMALIEAQASGLYCIASDAVPRETEVTGNIEYISLNAPIEEWLGRIKGCRVNQEYNRDAISKEAIISIEKHGFNIFCEAEKLEQIYNG